MSEEKNENGDQKNTNEEQQEEESRFIIPPPQHQQIFLPNPQQLQQQQQLFASVQANQVNPHSPQYAQQLFGLQYLQLLQQFQQYQQQQHSAVQSMQSIAAAEPENDNNRQPLPRRPPSSNLSTIGKDRSGNEGSENKTAKESVPSGIKKRKKKKGTRSFRSYDGKYLTKRKLLDLFNYIYAHNLVTQRIVTHPTPTFVFQSEDANPIFIQDIMKLSGKKTLGFGFYMAKIVSKDDGTPNTMKIKVKKNTIDICKSRMFSVLQFSMDPTSWTVLTDVKVPKGIYDRNEGDDEEDNLDDEHEGYVIVDFYKRKLKCKGVYTCDDENCEGSKHFSAISMNGSIGRMCQICGEIKVLQGGDCPAFIVQLVVSVKGFDIFPYESVLVFGSHDDYHGNNSSWKIPSPIKNKIRDEKISNPKATTSDFQKGYGLGFVPSESISAAENRDKIRNIVSGTNKIAMGNSILHFDRIVNIVLSKIKEIQKNVENEKNEFQENVFSGEDGVLRIIQPKDMKNFISIREYQILNLVEYLRKKREIVGSLVKTAELTYLLTMTNCAKTMFVNSLLAEDRTISTTLKIDGTYKNLKELVKIHTSFFSQSLKEEVILSRTSINTESSKAYKHVIDNTIDCVMEDKRLEGFSKLDIIKKIKWVFDYAQEIFTGLFLVCCEVTKTKADAYSLLIHIIQGCIFHWMQLAKNESTKQNYRDNERKNFIDCCRKLNESKTIEEIKASCGIILENFPSSKDFVSRRTAVLEIVRTCPVAYHEYFEGKDFSIVFEEKRKIILDRTGSRLENLHHTQSSNKLMSIEGALRRDVDYDMDTCRRYYNVNFKGARTKYRMMSEEKRALIRLTGGKGVLQIGRKQVLEQLKIVSTKRGAKNKGKKERKKKGVQKMSASDIQSIGEFPGILEEEEEEEDIKDLDFLPEEEDDDNADDGKIVGKKRDERPVNDGSITQPKKKRKTVNLDIGMKTFRNLEGYGRKKKKK